MFERERFSRLPGGALAVELEAVDPFALDDDALAGFLQAAKRLEAWADSLLARGVCAFAEGYRVPDPDGTDGTHGPDAADSDTGSDATDQSAAEAGTDDAGSRGAGSTGSRSVFPGRARPVRFGGQGTPVVDEFAAEALAPVLGVAPLTAGHLLGDALDLWVRLPWVRTGLRDGTVGWQAARAIASGTRDLSSDRLEGARVDQRLYRSATRLTPGQLRARIADVVAHADPDRVDDAAKKKPSRLYVGFAAQPQQQTTSIFGELDPTGAQRLDTQVSAVARLLRRLDPTSAWEALRARALTMLADPAALHRLQAKVNALAAEDTDNSGHDSDDAGGKAAGPQLSTTVVHLHTDRQTWECGDGLVEVEGYGWVPLWSLADLRTGTRVRVVPTDTGRTSAGGCVRHDPDPTYRPRDDTRDTVEGRDRTCRFPGCNRRARGCQCDHTIPWPHGPTCACNLGCLCNRHHRLKTHTRWALRQPWPGVFVWRTPTGHYWLVDHAGTTALDGRPPADAAEDDGAEDDGAA
ncbi:MAG TPA: DUF222 domain-containing protein [Nocardioidaceae bacterium]|nr:DUF222 domain-containing protein [Nocardioidaceae bacterium]